MTTRHRDGNPRPRPGARRGALALAAALGVGAALLLVLVLVLAGRGPQATADTTGAPVLAAPTGATGRPVDGIDSGTAEQLAFHVHAHLQIYVDGQQRAVPAGIGVVPPLEVRQTPQGPFVLGGAGIYWLPTHHRSRGGHIETTLETPFT